MGNTFSRNCSDASGRPPVYLVRITLVTISSATESARGGLVWQPTGIVRMNTTPTATTGRRKRRLITDSAFVFPLTANILQSIVPTRGRPRPLQRAPSGLV